MSLAGAPAVQYDFVSRLELRVRGRLDHAREVDSRDHGEATHHGCVAGERKAVFVIEGGVRYAHRDVALHQAALVKVFEGDALTTVAFLHHHGPKRAHLNLPHSSIFTMENPETLQRVGRLELTRRRLKGSAGLEVPIQA